MAGRRCSINVDYEGSPTQETVLIENGVLKGYLTDKLSSRLMGTANTGSGRRESYHCIPMPRMTNTYMLAGEDDPEDIIRSVKHGIYAVNFGGGQVDITNGKFVFSASEAYLIEDGHVTAPIRGATLIGNGPEALKHVSMVGNDLKLDEGVGTCGKDGQAVPVGVGVFVGKRSASTYSSDFSRAGLDRMLSSALELAKITSEDPFAGIPEPEQLGSIPGELDLCSADVYSLPGPERISYARRAEK